MNKQESKYFEYFKFLYWWFSNSNRIEKLKRIVEKKKWNSIAIYGIGNIGELIIKDFESINAKVYPIDKNPDTVFVQYPVYSVLDEIPEVDIVIVTPFLEYESIKEELEMVKKKNMMSVIELLVYLQNDPE